MLRKKLSNKQNSIFLIVFYIYIGKDTAPYHTKFLSKFVRMF